MTFGRFEAAVAREDWEGARREALAIAAEAEAKRDYHRMRKAGRHLVRLGECARGWRLLAACGREVSGRSREWDGAPLEGTLLVERFIGDLGNELRLCRFLPLAAERARRCVALVDPRLVPLLARSFPGVEVRAGDGGDADAVASFETLAATFAADWAAVAASYVALTPDAATVAELRRAYEALGPGPRIGISWGSRNPQKDTPSPEHWAELLDRVPAQYVSLQYQSGVPALPEARLHQDPTVDQFVDMDRFAAQIAALDAVVTVSNTAAHAAGALDVPSVVVIDDRFQMAWPAAGAEAMWYPRTRLVRQRSRPWPEVMGEAAAEVRRLLARAPRS
jgi:hypothetical protein